ncbi:hypothetical protein BDK51DRAFT_28325 [Blyttiomyces helicus]|uniref:Uncharacterized protein n=1 Tax=Blyttiomyces helicus TaxID=388810 RepID=A0A4P9WN70_9FUNG|nr:hypothetical protein BDK51DRAFT_28325 [Blyttiomyces helicus]|eukprot:RKO92206.1 hypothetical protein BDK51DRAFT_28325 [Blyttiomyces helicus]
MSKAVTIWPKELQWYIKACPIPRNKRGTQAQQGGQSRPLGDALTGSAVLATASQDKEVDEVEEGYSGDDGDWAQEDRQEYEQEDEQELGEAIEDASGDKTGAEENYYEDYSIGTSFVVAVPKLPNKNEGKCAVCLMANGRVTFRHHLGMLLNRRFGHVFAHARASLLQTHKILKENTTNTPDGGYGCYHKASEAYPTKDAREHAKMMKQAELLVQKSEGGDECGARMSMLVHKKNHHYHKQTTMLHQKGPRMSTGMHQAPTPAPTPNPNFQITKKVSPPSLPPRSRRSSEEGNEE